MNELRPGLWTWSAPHPSWTPDQGGPEGWEREVRSYALDAGDCLVLFDPLVEAGEVRELADGRPVVVVLTCYWHRRSTAELVDALHAVVHAPAGDIGELRIPAEPYSAGDDLPGDVEPQAGGYPNECTLWIRGHAALVSGDVFLGGRGGFRVQPDSWLAEGLTPTGLREQLQPLLVASRRAAPADPRRSGRGGRVGDPAARSLGVGARHISPRRPRTGGRPP